MGKFPRRIPFEMSAQTSLDLDTLLDWQIAEQILNK